MKKELPNFFIIGAPKCGTTSLAKWLSEHPQIFMSTPKEPHFWNTDMDNCKRWSFNEYKSLFEKVANKHKAIGEASTWYLYSKDAFTNIECKIEGAKYVVMVRNPIQMVKSLFNHNVRHCHEDAQTLEDAWYLQEERRKGFKIPKSCTDWRFLMYGEACCLGKQVERLLNTVPRERVLIIVLDDLKNNPKKEYLKLLQFLEVEDDGRTDFSPENEAKAVKNKKLQSILLSAGRLKNKLGIKRNFGLVSLNEKKATPVAVSKGFEEDLASFFEPDIRHLSKLLKRDFSHWVNYFQSTQGAVDDTQKSNAR